MPEKTSPNRFKSEMPHIPGVPDAPAPPAAVPQAAAPSREAAEPGSSNPLGRSALLSAALGVTLLLVGGIGWWAIHSAGHRTPPPPALTDTAAGTPEIPTAPAPQASGPVTVAALGELAKPWASKEFTFVDPMTNESVPAMAVHLAGATPESSASYWAFSLEAPYQTCHLVYVTNLSELATRFGYSGGTHPMVASPCDGTIYDPLKMGTISSGAWVRGEIVQGAGIRPPISIEVRVEGGELIADRIE
jgi:hypothetical protein